MIWHIFKKDCKLQWRFAALMAAIQFITATVVVKLSPLADSRPLRNLLQLLIMITLAGIPFLIGAAVHEDAIPGVRQDWLVRPIQRKDLLLAKFLFVLVAVHGPMFLADLFRGLAEGFPIGPSLAAALSRGLFVLVAFSIPLLAFMSLTKNTMEAIAAALVVFLAFAGGTLFIRQSAAEFSIGSGGLSWILEAVECLVALVAAAAVLGLQYFRRRTFASRVVTACACVLATLAVLLPWNPAFAVQQRMSPNPGAASAVAVSFDPSMGRFHRFTGNGEFQGNEETAIVYLPLQFENLPTGSALISDHAELRRQDASGADTRVGFGVQMSALRQETADQKPAAHLQVLIPGNVFHQIQDQPGEFKINLSLTLFRSDGSHNIPALNGNVHFPDLGTCVTKINAAETAVRVACASLEDGPSCFRMYLQHVPTGRTNGFFQCQANYTPFFDSVFVTPPSQRNLVFRDLSGLAKYPVDGTMLNESQVVLETYQPIDHFMRTVSIPSTRLRDWIAQQ